LRCIVLRACKATRAQPGLSHGLRLGHGAPLPGSAALLPLLIVNDIQLAVFSCSICCASWVPGAACAGLGCCSLSPLASRSLAAGAGYAYDAVGSTCLTLVGLL
jgi:hypothetical protein